MSPQFASPEQLRGQPIDFASEVYSLGKTICFLLTGAARLAGGATARHRRLPGLPRIPRRLRNLLRAMLSEEPPSRPQDPVALEQELLGCLTNIEKRTSIRRKLGIPAFAAWPKWATSSTPAAQILRGAIAFAVLILVGAGVMAAFFPRVLHFNRSANEIGVPIGVSQAATAQNSPAPAQSAVANPPPPVVASNQSTPPVAPSVAPTQSPLEVASANSANQTQPPAEGPKENSVSAQDESNQAVASTNSTPNESDAHASAQGDTDSEQSTASRSRSKARATESTTGTSHRSRYATDGSNENAPRYSHRGSFRAQQIGQTPDGRPILRLPSGRVIIATRGEPIPDYQAPRPRRLIRQPDVDDDGRAPWQPFNQPQD